MRQVIVGASVGDFVGALINDDHRMLTIGIRISVNGRNRPGAAGFIKYGIPIEPGGGAGLEIAENNVAPDVAIVEIINRHMSFVVRPDCCSAGPTKSRNNTLISGYSIFV